MKKYFILSMFIGVLAAPLTHAAPVTCGGQPVCGFLDGQFYDANGNYKYICFLDDNCLGADNKSYTKASILSGVPVSPDVSPITFPNGSIGTVEPVTSATPATPTNRTSGVNLVAIRPNQFSVNLLGDGAYYAKVSEIDFNVTSNNFSVSDSNGNKLPCASASNNNLIRCVYAGSWQLDSTPWILNVSGDYTSLSVRPIQIQDEHSFQSFTSNSLTLQ